MDVMFADDVDRTALLLEVNGAPNLATLDDVLMRGLLQFASEKVRAAAEIPVSYSTAARGWTAQSTAANDSNGGGAAALSALQSTTTHSARPTKRGREDECSTGSNAPAAKHAGGAGVEGRLDEISRRLASRSRLNDEDREIIQKTADCITTENGADIVRLLVRAFPTASLSRWHGARGHLIHYLVNAGSVAGLGTCRS